jgi:hypothetical protein
MILAVFATIRAAQKHLSAAAWQSSMSQKRGKVFTRPVFACFRYTDVESKRNFLAKTYLTHPSILAKLDS